MMFSTTIPYIDLGPEHVNVTWDDGTYATTRLDGDLPWQIYDAHGRPYEPSEARARQLNTIASAHLIRFVDDNYLVGA